MRRKMPRPTESDDTPFEPGMARAKDLESRAGFDDSVDEEKSTEDDRKLSHRDNAREIPREALAKRIRLSKRGE
jgi:hypothetical protein